RTLEVVIFKNGNDMEGPSYNFYRNALSYDIRDDKSFQTYWEPIHKLTSGYSNVFISPDGIFNKLSFNTLYNNESGKYLIDDQMISLISATKDLLKRNSADNAVNRTAALFGYPIFNTDQTEMASGKAVNRLYEEWMTDIDLLPGTKVEINNIESTLPADSWSISKKLESEASEKNIKSLQGPSVLHIATHGYFSEDLSYGVNAWKDQEKTEEYDFNPLLRSGLLFSKAETTVRKRLKGAAVNTNNDGILTAYEAMNLNLSGTDLVILSACETGLGSVRNGEGVYGLQRAFLVSGAKNLIMSLWKVNDKATQELMSSFYKKWIASGNLHAAFREAQLAIKEKYDNPLMWGGFILNGL
ncbi:MAG: CHAT domain-containing protein, partial [Fulvivirga sp.]